MIKANLIPLAAMMLLGNWFSPPKVQQSSNEISICESIPDSESSMNVSYKSVSEENKDERVTPILLEIVPEMMKFDQDTFRVKAGDKIVLEIDNLDGMEHNLLIAKPGTLEKVGAAADAMLRDPKASEKFYIPEIPEVLFSTKMIGPQELYTLTFTAPTTPGNYPFACTFPGHWRMMNGIMVVEG